MEATSESESDYEQPKKQPNLELLILGAINDYLRYIKMLLNETTLEIKDLPFFIGSPREIADVFQDNPNYPPGAYLCGSYRHRLIPGLFTKYRHGKKGILRAAKLQEDIVQKKNPISLILKIFKNQKWNVHSLNSYLLDAVADAINLQAKPDEKYTKANQAEAVFGLMVLGKRGMI